MANSIHLYKVYSGEEFNKIFNTYHFVKLTNETYTHHKFTYQEGLNVDTIKFNPTGQCFIKVLKNFNKRLLKRSFTNFFFSM